MWFPRERPNLLPAGRPVCKHAGVPPQGAVDILCQIWTTYGTDHVRITDSNDFGLCSRTISSGVMYLGAYANCQSQFRRASVTSLSHNSSVYGAMCWGEGFAHAKTPCPEGNHPHPDDQLTENRCLWKTWGVDRNRLRTNMGQRIDEAEVLFRSPPRPRAATATGPQGTLATSTDICRRFDPLGL